MTRPSKQLIAGLVLVCTTSLTCSRSDGSTPAPPKLTAANCPAAKAGAYSATVVIPAVTAAETTAVATVCITAGDKQSTLGGYQGSITFDSTAATVDTVAQHATGTQAVNADRPGVIRFAGAGSAPIEPGAMLTVRLRLKRPGQAPAVALTMKELNTTTGSSLLPLLWVETKPPARAAVAAGQPKTDVKLVAQPRDTLPRLISLDRETASFNALTSGEVIIVTIRGANLHETDNVLHFGSVGVTNVRSDSGGTLLRFSLPIAQPSRGDAPPMPLGPNDYLITVETPRGKSNALRFRITP